MALHYPRLGNASGVWNMKEVTEAVKGGYWPKGGARGVVAGNTTVATDIEYINIATAGDGTDFGDLTESKHQTGSASSHTRGLYACGSTGSRVNTIEYITIMTTGNGTDFGDATASIDSHHHGTSNAVRAIFAGGYDTALSNVTNMMDYVQMSSLGNATDYGDLTVPRQNLIATGSPTRGVWFCGGDPSGPVVTIDHVTIATTGDAADFGDTTTARRNGFAGSTGIRGIQGGGRIVSSVTTIDYVTIASTGNAIDYGDLTQARSKGGSVDNSTRMVFVGGQTADPTGTNEETIDYINIAVGGVATDFGDLTGDKSQIAGCSNALGGLQDGNQGVVDTT